MHMSKGLNKLLNYKVSHKLAVGVLFVMLIQLILPIRFVAYFLVKDFGISSGLLFFFELLTIPLTVLLFSVYLLQRFKSTAKYSSSFVVGFLFVILFFLTVILLKIDLGDWIIWDWMSQVMMWIEEFLRQIYKGWGFLNSLMFIYVNFIAVFPMFGGLLAVLVKLLHERITRLRKSFK